MAAVQILGGHWVALQSVAWIGMMVDYSKQAALSVAIEKTFDGGHPCALCKTVSKGRSEEQKDASAKLVVKLEAVLSVQVIAPLPTSERLVFDSFIEALSARSSAPPNPPPLA